MENKHHDRKIILKSVYLNEHKMDLVHRLRG